MRIAALVAVMAYTAPSPASAFYVPGWSIRSYIHSESIPLLVNKVYSDNTELQFAYADLPFSCAASPQSSSRHRHRFSSLIAGQSIPLNLGEVLRGDRITTSDIALTMGEDVACAALCEARVTPRELLRARQLVADGYVVEWIVDNLPGATKFVSTDKSRRYYASGFKLGFADPTRVGSDGLPRLFLNNHHTIVLLVRRAPGRAGDRGASVIVGFEVYPKSLGPTIKRDAAGCPIDLQGALDYFELSPHGGNNGTNGSLQHLANDDESLITIPYTYSVYFREDESIEWAHRWDLYFVNQDGGSNIHWLAIVNSLIICAVLTAVVAFILAKTIRSDLRSYRELLLVSNPRKPAKPRLAPSQTRRTDDEAAVGLLRDDKEANISSLVPELDSPNVDDTDAATAAAALDDVTGWKLLQADVFRPPPYGRALLAPLIGSGTQLLFMCASLVILGALGVLNPSFRGGYISAGAGLFVFAGLFSGYFSARVYRTLGGGSAAEARSELRRNALVTAALFPGLLFAIGFVLNLFVWAQASSTAVPFGTLISLLALWLCVQVPLVLFGSWYGSERAGPWEHPYRLPATGAMPRPIPQQPWYLSAVPSALLAGLLPFAVIFIELLFVFRSVWQDKSGHYYVFGFLAVVSAITLVAVAEVAVVSVYLQLCAEDPRWWWRSFAAGGASSVWVFAYCVWYYLFRLRVVGFVSGLLFFGYSAVACAVFGLLTGTVGFLSAFAFVRSIYGEIKVD